MKELIKKIIPKKWLLAYHYLLAQLAAILYWFPSKKMVVIGVTGTNGKSTTVNLIARILQEAGYKVGLISTVNMQVGDRQWLNNLKMTMPGRFYLQRLLRDMVRDKCDFAVIETSSEGILQHRHLGVEYDIAVFTNLTPEHLDAHGGFDSYKKIKLKLPEKVSSRKNKKINEKKIKRQLIANLDDKHAVDFLDFEVDEKFGYFVDNQNTPTNSPPNLGGDKEGVRAIRLTNTKVSEQGISFSVNGTDFDLQLLGRFDLYNAGASITTAEVLGVDLQAVKKALEKVENIPGRLEKIDAGQPFSVIVDYSPEPASLAEVYKTLENWNKNKIIQVLGSTGGGRDRGRRPILGYIAGTNADCVIVTNEDPYDDDPQEIIDEVAVGAVEAGLTEGEEVFKILERRKGIRKALELAKGNDLVLITGKGSEQAMVVKNREKIPWDDRRVVREELAKLGFNQANVKTKM